MLRLEVDCRYLPSQTQKTPALSVMRVTEAARWMNLKFRKILRKILQELSCIGISKDELKDPLEDPSRTNLH